MSRIELTLAVVPVTSVSATAASVRFTGMVCGQAGVPPLTVQFNVPPVPPPTAVMTLVSVDALPVVSITSPDQAIIVLPGTLISTS